MRVLTLQEVELVAGGHNGETHGDEPSAMPSKKGAKLILRFLNAKSGKRAEKAFAKLDKSCAKTGETAVCDFLEENT